MPSNWLSIDSNFPSFTGEESPKQQIQMLHNYLFQLREGMQYSLQNLTADNFNATALQNLTAEQKNEVTTELQKVYTMLNQLSNEIDSLSGRVSGTENLSGRMTKAEGEITSLKDRVGTAEENIEALADWDAETQKTLEELQEAVTGEGGLQERTRTLEDTVAGEGGLQEQMTELRQEQEKISGTVQVAEDGSATVGSAGQPLYLVGQIYINGVLYEQGGTT